jgi:hypothetical protein
MMAARSRAPHRPQHGEHFAILTTDPPTGYPGLTAGKILMAVATGRVVPGRYHVIDDDGELRVRLVENVACGCGPGFVRVLESPGDWHTLRVDQLRTIGVIIDGPIEFDGIEFEERLYGS